MRTYHKRFPLPVHRLLPVMAVLMLPLLVILFVVSTAVAIRAQTLPPPQGVIVGDLGDAPTTNMTAYTMPTFIVAQFPTIYVPGTPSGPFHRLPKEGPYLGNGVSEEVNAHLGIDEDIETNIDLAGDQANADGGESEVAIVSLIECEASPFTIDVILPVGAAHPGIMYLNAWFDFGRDGNWTGTALTQCGQLSEWAVQDWVLNLPPGVVTHTVTLTVTPYHPAGLEKDPLWMRMSLSDTPAPTMGGGSADGRGPASGYTYGETEDYLLRYKEGGGGNARAGWRG